MKPHKGDFQDLRQAFQDDFPPIQEASQCMDQDTLWEVVAGNGSPEQTLAIVNHTAGCPACAEHWRLAKQIQQSESFPSQEPKQLRRKKVLRLAALPLAAVLLLSFATLWMVRPDPDVDKDPPWRAAPIPTIESTLANEAVLDRQDCWLRWQLSKVHQGTAFRLRVTTADPFDVICDIKTNEFQYQIPAQTLERLAPKTPLLWRVSATLADQSTIHSPTFTNLLQ